MPERKRIHNAYGTEISLFDTERFKDLNMYFCFYFPFEKRRKTAVLVLKEMMKTGCEKYPDKVSFTKLTNMLYSAGLDTEFSVSYGKNALVIQYSFADLRYVKGVSSSDYAGFIKETLFKPDLSEERFKETVRLLRQANLRRMEKPGYYCRNKTVKTLCQDNPLLGIYDSDISDTIDEVTLEDVREAYDYLLNECEKEIILIGSLNDELISDICSLKLSSKKAVFKPFEGFNYKDRGEVTETRNISQTSINAVYKLNHDSISKGKIYYSTIMGMAFLGRLPSSLLFEEVREKRSLCYSISPSDYKYEGLLAISSSLSYRNKDELIKQSERQIERIISKDYDILQFEVSKKLLMSSFITDMDEAEGIFRFYSANSLLGRDESFEDFFKGIDEVSPDDLSDLFKGYRHILTYILKENEENR